jgi:hypothetical protein
MVNYWYDESTIAEAQFVLYSFLGKTEEQIKLEHLKVKFHHFNYELERNPLGCIVHCIELLIKEDV